MGEIKNNNHDKNSEGKANPTASYADHLVRPGSHIGPYKILSVLGEGGFGIAYLAEQEKPIKRRVALKIIKPGMDSKQVLARFEAERQALAVMNHPGIAKVIDGGTTATDSSQPGLPYFVMELVKGDPITKFCDVNRLTIRERMEIFVQICEAVQHAHSKGVIHRDLKPSNILITYVDGRPSPKIIDFGVAKALNQRLSEHTLFTMPGQMVGTPEYMSPEQAEMSGVDIDTRSDVYSLGVLLYELLTGTLPFEPETLRRAGIAEIQRIIREVDPPKPSTKLHTMSIKSNDTAAHLIRTRRIEHKALERILRGELDWIILKSLEKDRSRRYTTAAELGEEITRHLHGDLVKARPPSFGYRVQKLMRKYHREVVVVITFVVLLIGATIISTVFAIRSERALDVAETAESALSKQLLEARQQLIDFALMRAQISGQSRSRFKGSFVLINETVGYLSDAKRETEALMTQGIDRRVNTATQIIHILAGSNRRYRFLGLSVQGPIYQLACDARHTINESLSEQAMNETYVNAPDGEHISVKEAIRKWNEAFLDSIMLAESMNRAKKIDPEIIADGLRILTELRDWEENAELSSSQELLSLLLGEKPLASEMVVARCIELISVKEPGFQDNLLALQLVWKLLEDGTPDVIEILDRIESNMLQDKDNRLIPITGMDESVRVFICKAACYAIQGETDKACASLDRVISAIDYHGPTFAIVPLFDLNRMMKFLTQPENLSESVLTTILEHIGSSSTFEQLVSRMADRPKNEQDEILLEYVSVLATLLVEIEPPELARPNLAVSFVSRTMDRNIEEFRICARELLPILRACRHLLADRGDQVRLHQALDMALLLADNDESALLPDVPDLISDLVAFERHTDAHHLGVRRLEKQANRLERNPDDPQYLIELARELLTIAVKDLRDTERALQLAGRAVHLLETEDSNTNEFETEIDHKRRLVTALDTLGLAYFENGHPVEALRTQKRALALLEETDNSNFNEINFTAYTFEESEEIRDEKERAEMLSRLKKYENAVKKEKL